MTRKSETMDVSLSLIEKSLSSSLKYEIRLAKCTKFKKKRIFRCWTADGPSSLPEVFLVKIARHTKREPYNPKLDCVGSPAWKLFNPLDDAIYYKGVLAAWTYWLLRLGPIPNKRKSATKGTDELVLRCKAVARLSREINYLPRIGSLLEQVAIVYENR